MRGDKCYPARGKWVKIPLSQENVGKRSVNDLGTNWLVTIVCKSYFLGEEFCKGLYCLALNKSCFIERRLSLFLLSMLLNNPIYFYFPVLFSCLTGHRITWRKGTFYFSLSLSLFFSFPLSLFFLIKNKLTLNLVKM